MSRIVTLTMNPALDVSTSTASVRPTDKLRCTQPCFEPGGGGINVARVVQELGGEVSAIFPSGGPAGAALERLLGESGISLVALPVAEPSRESLTVDETGTGDQYRFVLPGPCLSEREQEQCFRSLKALDPAPGFVVASGSLPPGVPDDFYARVAKSCTERGARFILDTSGEPLRLAGGPVFLLKPNRREVEDLLGRDVEGDAAECEAAGELVDSGRAEIVVMSLGARGALYADRSGVERLEAIPVAARSAVGAGDSMVAGIVLGLERGLPLREAVRLGLCAGAAALLTPGTGLARREDVERLFGSNRFG